MTDEKELTPPLEEITLAAKRLQEWCAARGMPVPFVTVSFPPGPVSESLRVPPEAEYIYPYDSDWHGHG